VLVRIYNPEESGPTVVFVHGGGWAIGSIGSHDHITRWLASELGGRVMSVEYSLAPEHPYPTAINECMSVISTVSGETRGAPLFIAGDSAGANIAAMAILRLPLHERRNVTGFISIYGAYSPQMNLSSHRLYGDGRFGISEAQMRWFWNLYAPHIPVENRNALLSPLGADLSAFPPTLCIGAECDLLLDDTLAFYGELAKACTDVSLSLWSTLPHGCMHFVGAVESVTNAARSIVHFIKNRESSSVPGKIASATSRMQTLLLDEPAQRFGIDRIGLGDVLADVDPLFAANRSRLRGTVTHRIATDIIAGTFLPGSLLPNEENASASFGVSRSAYREAIRTLAAKGLVKALPKVGTRISPRSEWQILDPDILAWHFELGASDDFVHNLFELRKIVEPSAAALLARRRSDQQLSDLADSLARMAGMNPRTGGWLNAIIEFHKNILVNCGNEAVASLWPAIQTTLRWSVKLQVMLPTSTHEHDPVGDHAKVFEKIASQNAEGALQEMAMLVDSSLVDTIANIRRINASKMAS
jgi:acetyl esterase/lipase/DNA-binding FadR family transcriptional regulator